MRVNLGCFQIFMSKKLLNVSNICSSNGNYIVAGTGASQYLHEGHSVSDISKKVAVCGDTICEEGKGETHENCPQVVFLKENKKR